MKAAKNIIAIAALVVVVLWTAIVLLRAIVRLLLWVLSHVTHNVPCETSNQTEEYLHVLGLDAQASTSDIKKAYYAKARLYHPDLHPGDVQAEAAMKQVTQAYAYLTRTPSYSL